MNLYELTRKLIERGCPEHPRLQCNSLGQWWHRNCVDRPFNSDDARAIWTVWALEWLGGTRAAENGPGPRYDLAQHAELTADKEYTHREYDGVDLLEAIEAATRHRAPLEK